MTMTVAVTLTAVLPVTPMVRVPPPPVVAPVAGHVIGHLPGVGGPPAAERHREILVGERDGSAPAGPGAKQIAPGGRLDVTGRRHGRRDAVGRGRDCPVVGRCCQRRGHVEQQAAASTPPPICVPVSVRAPCKSGGTDRRLAADGSIRPARTASVT